MNAGEGENGHSQAATGNRKIAGLYIHIPFCRTKCPYCSFYSETNLSLLPDFLEALFQEMEMNRHLFHPLDTVYVGGGTPSVLAPHQIQALLEKTRHYFQLTPDAEITLEANPADLNLSMATTVMSPGESEEKPRATGSPASWKRIKVRRNTEKTGPG